VFFEKVSVSWFTRRRAWIEGGKKSISIKKNRTRSKMMGLKLLPKGGGGPFTTEREAFKRQHQDHLLSPDVENGTA